MIEQRKTTQQHWNKQQILSEIGQNATADEVLTFLLGDNECPSEYVVYKYKTSKRSLFNRLNMIWLTPIFVITLPIQWLVCGRTGVNRNSKLGRLVNKLVTLT